MPAKLLGRALIYTESIPSVIPRALYGVKVSLLASSRMKVKFRSPTSPPDTKAYAFSLAYVPTANPSPSRGFSPVCGSNMLKSRIS